MSSDLIDNLPPVRGRYLLNASLSAQTWFRVGGPADVLFRPKDVDDLAHFLASKPKDIPVSVIGAGSNLLVRDGGVVGVVIRLGGGFSKITLDGEFVSVGAGSLDRTVSLTCRDSGVGNLEFLVGIPGTIGGAIRMNAGAYGWEMRDILIYAEVLDEVGKVHRIPNKDLGFTYRHSNLPEGWIVTGALLMGKLVDPKVIGDRIDAILEEREASQPTRGRTGGSTFKNQPGQSAWELIDAAGCRGLKRGDAQVSEKHCNFLLNLENATASDIEALGEDVRHRVREASGVDLEWEIVRLGRF